MELETLRSDMMATFLAAEIREEMASFLALSLAFIAAIISLLKVSNSMVLFLLY